MCIRHSQRQFFGAEIGPKAHSGLFQFLPLGLRVQEKLEQLLDKHMIKLGTYFVSILYVIVCLYIC